LFPLYGRVGVFLNKTKRPPLGIETLEGLILAFLEKLLSLESAPLEANSYVKLCGKIIWA